MSWNLEEDPNNIGLLLCFWQHRPIRVFITDQRSDCMLGKVLSRCMLELSETIVVEGTLTHSLIHHFETIPHSKKLRTTPKMCLLKDFEIQVAQKTLWKKVKLLI